MNAPKIIKEYVALNPPGYRIIVRTKTYGDSLAFLLWLAQTAKDDYLGLTDDQITVVRYAGERQSRMYGLEFNIGLSSDDPRRPAEGYVDIGRLEPTV